MTVTPPGLRPASAPAGGRVPQRRTKLRLTHPITAPIREDPGYLHTLALLRRVAVELQNLRWSLADIGESRKLQDPVARRAEIAPKLTLAAELHKTNGYQVEANLKAINDLTQHNAEVHDHFADSLTRIENAWERASLIWPRVPPANEPMEPEDIYRRADAASREIDQAVFHIGLLTVPSRLNQHLARLRVGQPLDFHATFADEIERREDRQRVLEYLAASPGAVDGVVEVEAGRVLRSAVTIERRAGGLAVIALAPFAGAALLYVATHLGAWLRLPEWPLGVSRTAEVLSGYVFVLLGGVVHVAVDALKQSRTGGRQGFMALEDFILWVHVKESPILAATASLWVGALGLALLQDRVEWQTALFVGYSIDSVIDLFLQRFGSLATAQTAAIQKRVAPSQPTG